MSDIFISHASEDGDHARRIIAWLRDRGYRSIFLDTDTERGLTGGSKWFNTLQRELGSATALIFACSKESLESQWCFVELVHAIMHEKAVFPVIVKPCDPSGLLPTYQFVDLRPGAAEAEFRKLQRGLIECGLDPQNDPEWDSSRPVYPGFYAFDEADAAIYFGRTQEIDEISDVLVRMQTQRSAPLAIVHGGSGSGKSSLVRAGVVPSLKRGRARWIVVPSFCPGGVPIRRLATAIVAAFARYGHVKDPDEVAARLLGSGAGRALVDYANELREVAKQAEADVLVVVDQMEELFNDKKAQDETATFLRMLTDALSAAGSPLLAIATMRSEFLASFRDHEVTRALEFENYNLGQLPDDKLSDVIAGPAKRTGLIFEDGLIPRMVADTKTGDALPLLAFALGRMWERNLVKKSPYYTHELYSEVRGIDGAAATAAQRVLKGSTLDDAERRAVRSAFVSLVRYYEGHYMRRRVAWDDVPELARPVLQRFIAQRLLTSSKDEPSAKSSVEVVHEVLFTAWDELATWLREEDPYLVWRERFDVLLNRRARKDRLDADASARDAGADLLSGTHLADARGWLHRHPDRFDAEASAFIQRSAVAQRRRRWLARALWAAVVALPFVAFAVWQRVEDEQRRAHSGAFVAAALSQMASDPARSVQLALRARAILENPRADDVLRQAMVSSHVEKVLQGHAQRIESAVFGASRGTVITAGSDGVRLWSADGSARELSSVMTNRAAVSPDGRWVVTAGADGAARVWNGETGALAATLSNHPAASDKPAVVFDAAFSPDGTRVVTAQSDGGFLFAVDTGVVIAALEGHTDLVKRVAFDPTGRRIATASNDGSARLWDAHTGAPIATMRHSQRVQTGTTVVDADKVLSVAFSPDGQQVLTASEDKTARLWNGTTGAPIAKLSGHTEPVLSARFDPKGQFLVTASSDQTARVWDAEGNEIAALRGHAGVVRNAVFSPDGGFIATIGDDGTARLWETHDWREVGRMRGHTEPLSDVAFSADGRSLVTASADKTARVWRIESDTGIRDLPPHREAVHTAMFSKDGSKVLTAGDDGKARLWDLTQARIVAHFGNEQRPATAAVLSPNEQQVATVDSNGHGGAVWSAGDGTFIAPLRFPEDTPLYAAAFMPDGRFVATAAEDGSVGVWDTQSWQNVQTLRDPSRPTGSVYDVTFSPNGRLLATARQDGAVQLWTTESWSLMRTLSGHKGPVYSVAFDLSGQQLVTAGDDHDAIVWNVETGEPMLRLRAHTEPVWRATFSSDSKYIATGSSDLTARVWDAATGEQVATLFGHAGRVYSVAFSFDQRFIVTASGDRTIKTHRWETFAPVLDLADTAPTRMAEPLDEQQLAVYVAEPPTDGWFAWLGWKTQPKTGSNSRVSLAKGE